MFSNAMVDCWRVLLTMGYGVNKIPPCHRIPTKPMVVTLAVSGRELAN